MKMIYGEEPYRMEIIAIGISRDLTCKMRWIPLVEPHPENPPDPDAVYAADEPVNGWVPVHQQDMEKLYPNTRNALSNSYGEYKPGTHHWITIFECSGFKRQDQIEET